MQSKGLSRVFSNTTVQKHQFNPKVLFLALIVAGVSLGGRAIGLADNLTQTTTLAVFAGVIATTLFFWERRAA